MKIKKLTFILENCEVIEIDGKYVGDIGIKKIEERLRRIGIDKIMAEKICSEFYVEIHKDANQPFRPFNVGEPVMPFARLDDDADICTIEIECENNGVIITYKYVVKWTGKSNYYNELQDSFIGLNGNLYLKIGKKKIEKYFLPGATYTNDWAWG